MPVQASLAIKLDFVFVDEVRGDWAAFVSKKALGGQCTIWTNNCLHAEVTHPVGIIV